MYKKLLIIPYFGKFPPYLHLWINSCRHNPDIDWLVVTDNEPPCAVPDNMKWVKKSFDELREYFQRKFEFKIWLKKPYKLCDYKGFYGYLFSDYLEGYDFWGYCDCDVIFGRIHQFLPEELFDQYDKLLRTGHLSFIRNTPQINENFRKYDAYNVVLTSPVIYGYDEAVDGFRKGLAGELMASGYRFYNNDSLPADIDFRHYPFRIVTDKEVCCVFGYQDGLLQKFTESETGVNQAEAFYVHLQKRKMAVADNVHWDRFLIYPNNFGSWDCVPPEDKAFWKQVSTEQKSYYDHARERRNEFKRDLRRLLYEPNIYRALKYRFFKK